MSGRRPPHPDALANALSAELPCQELTPGEARYLLALHDLSRAQASVTQVAIARRLGVSRPTTLEMIRRLRQLDLIAEDRLSLTGRGTSATLVLAARRQAAEVLAHDILGLDEEHAHVEAERLTASLSPLLARRLVAWRASRHGGS